MTSQVDQDQTRAGMNPGAQALHGADVEARVSPDDASGAGDALPAVDGAERFLIKNDIRAVRVEWSDLHGASRGKWMSRDAFLAAVQGGTTFSSAALQMDLHGEAHPLPGQEAKPAWVNVVAMPDLATLQPYVIEPNTARCLAHLANTAGSPVALAPRYALQQVVAQGIEIGLEASVGLELEFYLLSGSADGRLPAGRHVYRMQSSADENRFLAPLHQQMAEAGIGVEALCAEDGPGQFELILQRGSPVEIADAAFTARNLIKELAARQGLVATFLSRPLADHSGCGAHIHQSLWTPAGDAVFVPDGGPGDSIFWHFLGGQLRHFKEASAFYLPTINSYKRLALRDPEPLSIDWAYEDRGASLRVLPSSAGGLRIENRAVAGEANPYLTVAAGLAAGFEGVRSAENLPAFSQRSSPGAPPAGEPLPRSLSEALESLDASTVLRRWLGQDLVDVFLLLKRAEVYRFETAITDWELREYLTTL